MRAIQIDRFGGPEVLDFIELPDPVPSPSEILIDVAAAGVNFADTHQVENSYLAPQALPLIPGLEVIGTDSDGRRVVALVSTGGYAEKVAASRGLTFEVPETVSDGAALALVLQGVTAWHLLNTCAHVNAGESVLVNAAAGGVGTIAVQLAKHLGANVIASASTEEKRQLAISLGADATVDSNDVDLTAAIKAANHGSKVDVVLEMVGGSVFDASLEALAPFGRLVTFGMASRKSPQSINAGELMVTSRAVIGFWLNHCIANAATMIHPQMVELFDLTERGVISPVIGNSYPLSNARKAHEDLRNRSSIGKLVLIP
ncbi:MAG TPA: NADPH:quinone oxidoreductase family protein [Candidatus Nanopelagicaceae bacterium]|nr:NADPH:quinone oxidoreductase family protein [Candidatus Nanopelagicaceae bacterium]